MIKSLKKVMEPPLSPVEIGDKEKWDNLEKKLNIVFPKDYKEFINTYGTGGIGDFLWVLNPFSENTYQNLLEEMQRFQNAYVELKEEFRIDYPRQTFPNKNSLLIWGGTDNGDYLFWVYNKDLLEWKVGIFEKDGEEDIFDMNMSTFLERLVKNEINTESFPEDFLEMKNKQFKSIIEM